MRKKKNTQNTKNFTLFWLGDLLPFGIPLGQGRLKGRIKAWLAFTCGYQSMFPELMPTI